MGDPINRAPLTAAQTNLVNGEVSDGPILEAAVENLYDYSDTKNAEINAHLAASTLPHADGSVTTSKIRDGAVTEPKLATGAVSTNKLADNSIITQKIQNNQITEDKMASGSASSRVIANQAVKAQHIDPALFAPYPDTAVWAKFAQVDSQFTQVEQRFSEITQSGFYKSVSKMQNNQSTYVIAVGDSVTWSVQPSPSSAQVPNPYPALLQEKLRMVYNNNNITVENQGKSGWSAATWLASGASAYYTNVINKHPDMIVLMLGINDVQSGFSSQKYKTDAESMIKIALDNGIEVLLLSPTMVMVKNDFSSKQDVNTLVYEYAEVCKNLASLYNIGFIDMQNEFMDLVYNKNVYLASDLVNATDFVHPTELGYAMIANLVVKQFQRAPVMVVDSEKSFGAVGCPYIESNIKIADSPTGSSLRFKQVYLVKSDKYIKFRFMVLKNNLSLYLLLAKSYYGGQMDIYLDNTLVATVNEYDSAIGSAVTRYGMKTFISDVSNGYHELLISGANMTKVNVDALYMFILEAISFEDKTKNKRLSDNATVQLANNAFVSLRQGNFDDFACLRSGRTLVCRFKGYGFVNSSGILINNTITATGTDSVANFISFASSKIQLTTYNINSGTPVVTAGTSTIDLTKELDIRIEIDSSYGFKVYCNNVLEVTASNSQNSVTGGYVKLLNQSGSTITLSLSDFSIYSY